MKISFWIPAIVLYAVSIAFTSSVQVGTVLFSTTDLVKRCWTDNDKSVLRARLIMQDLLPDPDCIDFSNPKAAVVLLDYFLACYEIINKFCYGKVQNLMFVALSDAVGGYLRAYVLPYAKRAYYAGQMKYSETEQIFRLYNNIRIFLKTNGEGWAEPQKLSKRDFHVSPLVITGGSYEACNQLRIIEKSGKLHRIKPHHSSSGFTESGKNKNMKQEYFKKSFKNSKDSKITSLQKRSPKENEEEDNLIEKIKKLNSTSEREKLLKDMVGALLNETEATLEKAEVPEIKKSRCRSTCNDTSCGKRVIVPLPMLDDCQNPQSIAVPFKNSPFRNLHSPSSAYILEYYYMAVIKCFIAAGNTITDIKNFNIELYSWLCSQVLPHLRDEQWYPGFGGVLRVVETIKKFGVESGLNEPSFHDIGFVFGKGVTFDVGSAKEGKDQPRNTDVEFTTNTKRHVVTAILVVSLLWLLLFCACAFYTHDRKKPCQPENKGSWTSSLSKTCSRSCSRSCSESRSESRSGSKLRCMSPLSKKNSKSMSLQFFVKFFKKKADGKIPSNKEKKVCWSVKKIGHETLPIKQHSGSSHSEKCIKKKEGKLKKILHGQGDTELKHEHEHFKPFLTNWPSQACFGKKKIKFAPAGDAKLDHPPEPQSNVYLLWKKPSIRFDREVSRMSTRRLEECSCCRKEGQQISTSCSHCSSQSEDKKMISSTTMECFEDYEAKRRPFLKNLILASSEETECDDDEGSTSYESEY